MAEQTIRLRVALAGENARLGHVPAADIARLFALVERAAAQAAAVVLGQPKTTTGRYKGPIEQAVHFRLAGIESGSVVGLLELPAIRFDERESLDLEDPGLGQLAIDALMAAYDAPSDPVTARALLDVADGMLVGERYDSVTLTREHHGQTRAVVLNASARERLRAYVDSAFAPDAREDEVAGTLVEADFERRTARLRTPADGAIEISFGPEHADDIQRALRQRSTVRGEVVYDPTTNVARTVRLAELLQGAEQLSIEADAFWRATSFSELAALQNAGAAIDPHALRNESATDSERDAFMAALSDLD